MTTGLVSGISPITELTNIVNSSTKATGDSGTAFSDVLKANSSKQTEVKETNKSDSNNANPDKNSVAADRDNKTYTKTERNIKSADKVESTEEELTDDVMAAAAQAVEIVANVLEVPVENVEKAIEALDMAEAELLDSTNLSQVVVEITGAEDTLSLMTDEKLYEDLKEITGQINELVNSLEEDKNVSFEDVKNVIDEIAAGNEKEVEMPVLKSEDRGETKNENHSENSMSWTESIVDSIKTAATEGTDRSETVYSTDMEQIYEQVSESMKLSLSEDVTEMEINLHPASLGNVKIQVAAKDGVITANFTTQNETVKAALETQIIQLKENMAEQGIKVEAIEVAVAAHAFEENLSKQGESSGSEETETKRKRRSINLNDIDDIDDNNIVEDEVRIAREMMAHNGTTVDYMA